MSELEVAWNCTDQELEVLGLLSEGKTSRQVSKSLGYALSAVEVERLVVRLINRTRSVNRVNLIATAVRRRVIE